MHDDPPKQQENPLFPARRGHGYCRGHWVGADGKNLAEALWPDFQPTHVAWFTTIPSHLILAACRPAVCRRPLGSL
jgi:hypothetical protein